MIPVINDQFIKKKYKRNSVVLLFLLLSYLCIKQFPKLLEGITSNNYILPALWLVIIIFISSLIPKIHPLIQISKKESVYFDAIICGMIFVASNYLAAIFIFDIAETPYDLTLYGILINFIRVMIPFIGIELIRSYVLKTFCREKNIAFLLFIAVIITLINLNIQDIGNLTDEETITIYIAQRVAPAFCKNIILSYLALYGGAAASIFYGGILLIFHWFFPILPQLNWFCEGVLGIIIPVIELLYLVNKYESLRKVKLQDRMNSKNMIGWIGFLAVSVVLLWFVVGVFPVYPKVIATGSMQPLINQGDIAIIQRFSTEEEIKELKAGDIILFNRDDIKITHRIIKVIKDENGNVEFRTKGDNNSAEDSRIVLLQEVEGRYILAVPKIGYPTLWLKSSNSQERDDVEY